MAEDIPSKETSEKIPLKDVARARSALERAAQKGNIPTQPVKPKVERVPPFYPKPKVDWQPWQKEVNPIKENQEYVEKNMPWVLRIFKRNREATQPDVLKRQSEAGFKGQPELTTEERRKIQEINFPSIELSDADRELLKKQGTAGINGQPDLTPEERHRIAEINARPRRQPK